MLWYSTEFIHLTVVAHGGLMVNVLANGPHVRGFKPG
jgi:hypothetical protein